MQESLKREIDEDEREQWRKWFDLLGQDVDESDVEFAFGAQSGNDGMVEYCGRSPR